MSPPYKEGFLLTPSGISKDGSRVLAQSFGTFSGTEDASTLSQAYELARTEEEPEPRWSATPLSVPFSAHPSYLLDAIGPEFDSGLWIASQPLTTPGQASPEAVYVGLPGGAGLEEMGPAEPPIGGGAALEFAGASEDLHHALFIDESAGRLWPGDTTAAGRPSLYEYAGVGKSEPQLVGISDSGRPADVAQSHLISTCGTYLGGIALNEGLMERDAYNAVSSNGTVVVFTARAAGACGGAGPSVDDLYARIDGEHTVNISDPEEGECEECVLSNPANAAFRGASLDGSKVFFTTTQALLPGATGVGANLYEYNFDAPRGRRVIRISRGSAGDGDVLGVARVSEDGSHVYFVAEAVLTGANREGREPMAGAPNLYVYAAECPEGGTACGDPVEHLSFVGTLSAASDTRDWAEQDARPAQATPDGHFLVFVSADDLTPDEGAQAEAGQVFEYDAGTETLARVSRGEDGYDDDGNSSEYAAIIPTPSYERDPPIQRFTRLAVSADGSRVFFSTRDALTSQALNGVNNVYEYHNGQVALISDGHDAAFTEGFPATELVGTDESGRDVFFMTADRLVPQDADDQVDLYDARIEGGLPAPAEAAPCVGDSCQATADLPPPLLAPLTSSIAGEAIPPAPIATIPAKRKLKAKAKSKPRKRKGGKSARKKASGGKK